MKTFLPGLPLLIEDVWVVLSFEGSMLSGWWHVLLNASLTNVKVEVYKPIIDALIERFIKYFANYFHV